MTVDVAGAVLSGLSARYRRSVPLDLSTIWTPHPGPQTAFLQSTAYEVLYGGAAGGGKTDALLYGPLDQMHIPQARALFLRRTYPELQQAMDRALASFPRLGATWNEREKRWEFPSGAHYEFGYADTYRDVQQYQGDEYNDIAVDELGLIADERVWTYLMTRNRTTSPYLRRRMRASANPGGAGAPWIKRRFIDRCPADGTPIAVVDEATGVDLSRAFFSAHLSDNPSLEHNAEYRATFALMPETLRRQLLDGDWSAGDGMALRLSREVHLVRPYAVPDRWTHYGALDWGFNHPFVAGWFAADDDGNIVLVDSVMGRKLLPHEIAGRIAERFPLHLMRQFVAGHDCWNEVRARGENTPSIADQFRDEGIRLTKANISRASGLNNLRLYLDHDPTDLEHHPPRFTIMDTPGNRRVYETLESMVTDPDNPEDALKVDATEYGTGGDDAYDMVRYGLAARPLKGKPAPEPEFRAFSPEALAADVEKRRIFTEIKKRRAKIKKRGIDEWFM